MSVSTEILETIAGVRCPCGHLVEDEHEPPDPDFDVGDLREVCGACHECGCKGIVE